jgi:glycosyltransferase involved in cell wall biosynthesis
MAQATSAADPLVSVVTPFYNTAPYLAECIESVLAQTYPHFEYILMDNCSTDGSGEIAESYSRRDPRIRLIQCSEFLSQLGNYNRALTQISDDSKYCKVVQADDWIFPECLQLMVQAFKQSESIGLVSSYWISGDDLWGSGFPLQTPMLSGKEAVRGFLRADSTPFGSQTQVMYRSAVVRNNKTFYNVSFPFADVLKCIEILEHWDYGFVYQVLSFARKDNDSVLHQVLLPRMAHPLALYIMAQRYAPVFLEAGEVASTIATYKLQYYRALARGALQLRGPTFWRFHKAGLKVLGHEEKHDWPYLAMVIGAELLWLASNPGMTTVKIFRRLRSKIRSKRVAPNLISLPAEFVASGNGSIER